jgi:hypothetical protein
MDRKISQLRLQVNKQHTTTMPIFDVTVDKFNVLVYMNNIEAHQKDDNCFHDDDDDNNTQINMHNLKHKQRQSRL